MKQLLTILFCIIFLLSLTACGSETQQTETQPTTPTETVSTSDSEEESEDGSIIGTWVCDDINKDCYFIFEENGDAFAKWGTSTIYGYFDYYEEDGLYEIDIPNFLYNDYRATFNDDEMQLKSDESSYVFEKATMPEVTIDAPNDLQTNDKLIGDWQSESSYECYRFNDDNTAVITDMLNYATIDCKYSFESDTATMYYMVTEDESGSRKLSVEFINDDEIKIDDYVYKRVTN